MKINSNYDFFKSWCTGLKKYLEDFMKDADPMTPEECFTTLEEIVDNLFAWELHGSLEDVGGVQCAAKGVHLSFEEIQHVIEEYGEDDILTEDKIGEYALYNLATYVIEFIVTKYERVIDAA
ncbi:hypothetical protein [Priestia megaterium]|uniref:hypothetical protein n=1 Tax=Priestia megaterium TaxID=1404 RepID=UPI002E1F1BEA|nr:hypothetical protein [Priestia megaterium]